MANIDTSELDFAIVKYVGSVKTLGHHSSDGHEVVGRGAARMSWDRETISKGSSPRVSRPWRTLKEKSCWSRAPHLVAVCTIMAN